jgi:hypothetical protein
MTPPETVPCPGCTAPMGLEEEVCGTCRRPRDEYEISAGKAALAARERAVRARPFKMALWLVAGAAAYACYQARGPLLARLARERADVAAQMDQIADPAKRPGGTVPQTEMGKRLVAALGAPQNAAGDAPPPSATIPMASPAASSSPSSPTSSLISNAPVGGTGVAPALVPGPRRLAKAARAPGTIAPNLRKVYGVVYEFNTGLAIQGAEVYIRQGNGARGANTFTDADGYYELDFNGSSASVGDITVCVSLKGVDAQAIDESDPPYRLRSAQMRREDLAALREHDPIPIALHFTIDEVLLHRDVVVLPSASAADR